MLISLRCFPQSLSELKAMPESSLTSPEYTAALTVASLCLYEDNPREMSAMLEFLKGPNGALSPFENQFLRDRLGDGRAYIPRSFFVGAVPENDYTPSSPSIDINRNQYSQTDDTHITLWMTSGGADNPRQISMRLKPSTGQWFLNDGFGFLSGIRTPVSKDPWA